jgi:hypothetical protein
MRLTNPDWCPCLIPAAPAAPQTRRNVEIFLSSADKGFTVNTDTTK